MHPIIVFDIDGTLTDFRSFIRTIGIPYFEMKYYLKVKNPDALELEDIFELDSIFFKRRKEANAKRLLDKPQICSIFSIRQIQK
ncbi:hypothetical protein [Pseudobutyrivibrio xylanivorans]|uniref:Uncharacterized protein n=1 Tax=Pseudobutyrivibrio xylanivorans TaxID=185007 RepID=A0A5P6VS27_PSEXY|nr:hypothetical protein [Pseudobutyrivibrio xylanivorans]QFJ54509.1 hypothetical protein FXF36_06360 [Pseudobutyrivibrio xylanivorans]